MADNTDTFPHPIDTTYYDILKIPVDATRMQVKGAYKQVSLSLSFQATTVLTPNVSLGNLLSWVGFLLSIELAIYSLS